MVCLGLCRPWPFSAPSCRSGSGGQCHQGSGRDRKDHEQREPAALFSFAFGAACLTSSDLRLVLREASSVLNRREVPVGRAKPILGLLWNRLQHGEPLAGPRRTNEAQEYWRQDILVEP